MHISRVDLNLFVIFDTVLAEGGITAASRKLNLSQPAVSHALTRLRGLLGDPLFQRQGRAMVATPLARAIAAPVRAALRNIEGTLHQAMRFDPASSERRFTLAFRDVLELILVPPLMQALSEEAPQLDIIAARMNRRSLESDLFAGRVDIGIDVLLPVSSEIRCEQALAEPMVVVARKGHPALAKKLDLKSYLAQQHIQVSSRRRGPGLEDLELARVGVSRRIRLRCQHYGTACRTVSMTDLLATMPARYATVMNQPYGNEIRPLPLKDTQLELYLYWHRNTDADPAGIWLRERLRTAIANT
ncbi:LysR family transcriptional regulator [Sulfuritalea sp.]|uniref:LysR family transcriptional regulator n=1 Tax=Sulfuritalea sp. TaxID=2480090 RepID=UPI00286DCE1C|nr:LysR family transcriptional regulator [Sulfuritalea sp.]